MIVPVSPQYGGGALADVLPSVAGALSVPGESNLLGLPPAPRYAVLLFDGRVLVAGGSGGGEQPVISSLAGAELFSVGPPATWTTIPHGPPPLSTCATCCWPPTNFCTLIETVGAVSDRPFSGVQERRAVGDRPYRKKRSMKTRAR